MIDERFYSAVTQELVAEGPVPGLWAKCFAEAEGNEVRAKALYLRLRAEQLEKVERSAANARDAADELERLEAVRAREGERKAHAREEGFQPIHGVLLGLALLMLGLVLFRGFF